MRTKLLFTILATTMLIATVLQSAEVIPEWMNIWKQGGWVNDFELLRGEDQFILIAGVYGSGVVEIRQTLTGELVKSFPLPTASYFNQIEITPDSNRIVITTGGDKENKPTIELRSIENFELVKKLDIKMDADSVDKVGQPYYYVFNDIVIDPIKPYIYAFITKTNYIGNDDDKDRTWLKVYNYETMEEIKDLTPKGYENELMKCMDISDDGRQLAVINEGKTYLKIWNTETLELITDRKLYDDKYWNPEDYWCNANDIEFSHIDNDLIYISGFFPNKEKSENPEYNASGLHKYNILNDNFFKVFIGPQQYKEFTLFDNEERVLLGSSRFVVWNQKTNKQEIYIDSDIKYPTGVGNIYSKKFNFFLGGGGTIYSGFRYDSQTSINLDYEEEIIVSPNPTNSFVNINLNCTEPIISYQINDINGLMISQNTISNQTNNLRLDFSTYPIGVYFITINCSNQLKTYKIVKEG